MLWGYDRLDDSSKIVDIRQCLDAEENIIEGGFPTCGIFRGSNNWKDISSFQDDTWSRFDIPCKGLNRSLPKSFDLESFNAVRGKKGPPVYLLLE